MNGEPRYSRYREALFAELLGSDVDVDELVDELVDEVGGKEVVGITGGEDIVTASWGIHDGERCCLPINMWV